MAEKSIDRRASRTRTMLQQAHVDLILKKGYDRTTIQDICDAANVGRSTFYAHYRSKEDLRRSSLERLRRLLTDRQRDALAVGGDIRERGLAFSLPLFEHAREHVHLYRALVATRGGVVALRTIRGILSDLVRNELAANVEKEPADAYSREFAVHYIVGATMAVLTWWLDSGAKLPPQRVDTIFRRLAIEGLTTLYS